MPGLEMKYFVLNPTKTDDYGKASRAAMLSYAEKIEPANRALANDLRTWAQRLEPSNDTPRIGEHWAGQGGIYAGVARGQNGAPDYHLIVAEPGAKSINWHDATAWASSLAIDGYHDFTLPLRPEHALLYGNVPELFEKEWYWSSEQYASDDACAWFQSFSYGDQHDDDVSSQLRARAVRRLIVQ